MEVYLLSITILGFIGLAISWIVHFADRINISYSLLFLLLGLAIYSTFDVLPWVSPFRDEDFTVHLTELMVIIALMSTGLRIDRPFRLRSWRNPFLLVTVTMLLCIGAMAAIGYWWLGFGLASAVLLGAVLAPTDPVLAGDVQVGPPLADDDDEVRFSLTAEAGLNDGLAFPFTWLAIALAVSAQTGEAWLGEWIWKDVVYRIGMGAFCGFVLGRLVAWLFLRLPDLLDMPHVQQGLVAISATLLVYGITEMVHGYGFIAVFVAAITIRNYEMDHEYHKELHEFTTQIERILLAMLLILFGGALTDGILHALTWPMALAAVAFVLLVRPAAGWLTLMGSGLPWKERLAVSFFGIRGIGSFFYLAFALKEAEFPQAAELWSFTAFVVLVSLAVHGLTAALTLRRVVPTAEDLQKP